MKEKKKKEGKQLQGKKGSVLYLRKKKKGLTAKFWQGGRKDIHQEKAPLRVIGKALGKTRGKGGREKKLYNNDIHPTDGENGQRKIPMKRKDRLLSRARGQTQKRKEKKKNRADRIIQGQGRGKKKKNVVGKGEASCHSQIKRREKVHALFRRRRTNRRKGSFLI